MDDTVILEIEGTSIKCSRADLIAHSDYFKAMLEGNFVESSMNVITLNDVDVRAMNIILKLLWNRDYSIEEEDILSVLHAACMLQFLEIKEQCIERIQEVLSVKNCLKFWLYTEQLDLEIHLKAQLMALMEFPHVKDSDGFVEMHLNEVLRYLGNVYLQCNNEIEVFKAIMKWYESSDEKSEKILLKLLYCINFERLKKDGINEIISCKIINQYTEIVNILKCICSILSQSCDLSTFQENHIETAKSLVKFKNRNLQGVPCILVENLNVNQENSTNVTVLYYDKFKRKRKYSVLEPYIGTNLSVVDVKKSIFKKILDMDLQKCCNLDGFKMVGYKNFIYLLGGEFFLGKGDWNYNMYIYDMIKEEWKQKTSLPYPRRHFEICICEKKLFVVGGTGPFRVIQKNLFWYGLEDESWSVEVKLPCSGREFKCCQFDNKLFLLNINSKCGYLFDSDGNKWTKIEICDNRNVLPSYSKKLSLFCYKDSIYIKDSKLFELKLVADHFSIVNETELEEKLDTICQTEAILCGDELYSLNKYEDQTVTLDIFNMASLKKVHFENSNNKETFKFKSPFIMFNVFHPNLFIEQ